MKYISILGLFLFFAASCGIRQISPKSTAQKIGQPAELDSQPDEIIPDTGGVEEEACAGTGMSRAKMMEWGERLYTFYCVGCHGRKGEGYPGPSGFFPALAENGVVVSSDLQRLVDGIMNTNTHPRSSELFEKDTVSLVSFLRNSFGNQASIVCPGDVVVRVIP